MKKGEDASSEVYVYYRTPGPTHPTTIRMRSHLFSAQHLIIACSTLCLCVTIIIFVEWARHDPPKGARYHAWWHDAPSDAMFRHVCEVPAADVKQPDINGSGMTTTCPDSSWSLFRDSCYRLGDYKGNFNYAQYKCAAFEGGHLASIGSEEENDMVWRVCGKGKNQCWIGLHEAPGTETWTWDSGEVHDYEHWDHGEPNNFGGRDEDAAFMGFNKREWMGFDVEGLTLSLQIVHFSLVLLIYCLWRTFLPRKNVTGLYWTLAIERVHCICTFMYAIGALGSAVAVWAFCGDLWRVWFALVPPLFLTQFFARLYGIQAAEHVRNSLKVNAEGNGNEAGWDATNACGARVYGAQGQQQQPANGGEGGNTVVGIPVPEPSDPKSGEVTPGFLY